MTKQFLGVSVPKVDLYGLVGSWHQVDISLYDNLPISFVIVVLKNGPSDPVSISHADHEAWDRHAGTLAIISHDKHIRSLKCFVVCDNGHHSSVLLDMLCLKDKVTVSSVDHDYQRMPVALGPLNVALLKVVVRKRLTSVLVLEWVYDSPLDHCSIVDEAKVAHARKHQAFHTFLVPLNISFEALPQIGGVHYLQSLSQGWIQNETYD